MSDFTAPNKEARVASIDWFGSSSTGMDCEGRAVSSSTTGTSVIYALRVASCSQSNDEFFP